MPRQHRTSKALLTYIRERQNEYRRDRELFGSPTNAALLRIVTAGWIEGRPYDQSGLAEALLVSRQRVMRSVAELSGLGWITIERQRNRVLIHPTPKLLDHVERVSPGLLMQRSIAGLKLVEVLADSMCEPAA